MNNEPVAWMYAVNGIWTAFSDELPPDDAYDEGTLTPLYTHPAKPIDKPDECISGCPENQTCDYCAGIKTLTDEEIDSVIHELRQKSFDPERWVDVYTIAIETIIQLRDELAILRKAQEK